MSHADELAAVVGPENVLSSRLERVAFASDASAYRLIPQAVVRPRGPEDVRGLFAWSHARGVPITFRAAGTSLSGQAITDGVLVDVSRHWRAIEVRDGGLRVRVEPGAVAGHVNAALRPYAARIGPDPASINACMMGGVLANNSSGMCCGVVHNAYHTLESLSLLLPSGTAIDTAGGDADDRLREREPQLHGGLAELRGRILADAALASRIRAKYRMKNTMGYSLNAFVDFERPADILAHLMIGSEGTLAFIAGAVLRSVPDRPWKRTGLLLFEDLHAACSAIGPLRDAGAAALELMDRASLRAVESQPGLPVPLRGLPDSAAAILAEFQAADQAEADRLGARGEDELRRLHLLLPARFSSDAAEQAQLWRIRSGLVPSVGATRRSGTSFIIEDVAFPVAALADATLELTRLFAKHGYAEGIVFGHAKDGNLHFCITQSFGESAELERYARFMDDVAELVITRYDGALKAEHGTGRNMAPFVEKEWGSDALAVMKRVKQLCDPSGLLNPGVVLSDDPRAHLRDLKPLPSVESEVDRCIECGYCESKCPSRDLTLTPRQRIVVRREMARLAAAGAGGGDAAELAELEADFGYMALDTCAADGLCATACPVSIDTGQLVKRLRHAAHSPGARRWARRCSAHFAATESLVRAGLRLGHAGQRVVGAPAMAALTRGLRRLAGHPFPLWSRDVPRAARKLPAAKPVAPAAVYFPSCVTRLFGAVEGQPGPGLAETLVTLGVRAGRPVRIPDDVAGSCCGVAFSSKGYDEASQLAANRLVERLWRWSEEARLPVVVDTSPCTLGLLSCGPGLSQANRERLARLRILDSVVFAHDELLPRLEVRAVADAVVLHPVCSLVKMGQAGKLAALARALSLELVEPIHAGCCGFAGDRGWLFPELTASATRVEAAEVAGRAAEGYSSSRTCEIGLTRATGRPYRSVLHLLERATRR